MRKVLLKVTSNWPRGTRLALVSALLGCVAALAACGSGGSDKKTTTAAAADGGGGSTNAAYQQKLDELYKGTYTEPTGDTPAHEPGKKIWMVSVDQAIPFAKYASDGMNEAADSLGWSFKIFNGKSDPNRQLSGIQQALAAGADGIIVGYIDCPVLKTGLQQAKKAGVPVVDIEGSDCDQLKSGDPKLFSHIVNYAGGQGFREWIQSWGAAQAAWVIAKTGGKAKTILTRETDTTTTNLAGKGAIDGMKTCSTCEIVETVDFVGPDLGPPLQQKIEQALIRHPDADSFISAYDGVLTAGGGANALKSSGRLGKIHIMGGEGDTPNIELIASKAGDDACIGIPTGWEGYAAMDAVIRLFAKDDPSKTTSGIGIQVCDREHNMPPAGKAYEPPIDYVAAYKKSWGVE
jgi:ribose transport system substrate-binding protein